MANDETARNATAPSRRPCASCPYRRHVPSGVWAAEEYDKLPAYDRPTQMQPAAVFLCHQGDGRICAGWAGTHDMAQSLAIRVAILTGDLTPETAEAVLAYAETRDRSVELFGTGQEAADHGKAEMIHPPREPVASSTASSPCATSKTCATVPGSRLTADARPSCGAHVLQKVP